MRPQFQKWAAIRQSLRIAGMCLVYSVKAYAIYALYALYAYIIGTDKYIYKMKLHILSKKCALKIFFLTI